MASPIVAPVPLPHLLNRPARKDSASLQLQEEGRTTPLPKYEKTPAVPFHLTLQEDMSNPGQFQLVVDINPVHKRKDGSLLRPAASKRLYTNLQALPGLGYDVSSLYQTQKSSPPTSPQQEMGWSDLDAIPSDFLQKVVPDWEVTFQRKDSTASTQSRKLADIKARIKKSGRGFVVRLLKGSNPESNEVAEVQLGQEGLVGAPAAQELDSCPQAELDGTESAGVSSGQHIHLNPDGQHVFEIGTSGEPGIQPSASPTPSTRVASIPQWLSQTTSDTRPRYSVLEDGFSDAETLAQEVQSIGDRLEDDTQSFPMDPAKLPMRATSIVKTPTRGLSIVGPTTRTNKYDRAKTTNTRGKAVRLTLNRADAKKSFKRLSPHSSIYNSVADYTTKYELSQQISDTNTSVQHSNHTAEDDEEEEENPSVEDHDDRTNPVRKRHHGKGNRLRSLSAEHLQAPKQRSKLKLQTNVDIVDHSDKLEYYPHPPFSQPDPKLSPLKPIAELVKPANSSPVARGNLFRRTDKSSSTSSVSADLSEELREALERAFGTTEDDTGHNSVKPQTIPRIEEPVSDASIGQISLPSGLEIRSTPTVTRSPTLTFWGLALGALSERLIDGLQAIRIRYGPEILIAPNHVRVRWTCSCGEPLYDDFVERRPGAARFLEAYLNRPRSHTPVSPTGRTSTSSTMSSVFSTTSTASTLATPASTYGGSSWRGKSDQRKYSPIQRRSNSPFNVRIGSYIEEQWLLTCANEGRFTPKIVHLDVNAGKIKSDKDLALALRDHYEQLNRRWLKWARLRGLATIEFVQFEVHRNRFADIRASPSMPPISSLSSAKSPSEQPYSFEPVDLVPPVGSTYLLHLFKHPNDYDNELVTYLRAPKRRERLEFGMGWGINLVEGFLVEKVWMCVMFAFGVGSGIFGVVWTAKKGDVQGAFGVAGWIVTLAALVLGGMQAWLD